MYIEIKIQQEEGNLDKARWDSIVLSNEMVIDLIDHHPEKLKKIIKELSQPKHIRDYKGLSNLLIAVEQYSGQE